MSLFSTLRLAGVALVIALIAGLAWRVEALGRVNDRLVKERDEARGLAGEWAASYATLEKSRAEADRALAEIQIVTVQRREALRSIEEVIRDAEVTSATVLPAAALHALGRLRDEQRAETERWATAYPGLFPAAAAVPAAARLETVGDLSTSYLRLHEFAAGCVEQIGTIRVLEAGGLPKRQNLP